MNVQHSQFLDKSNSNDALNPSAQSASTSTKALKKNSKNQKVNKSQKKPAKRKSSQSRRVVQMRFSVLPEERERVETMVKPFGSISNFVRFKIGLVNIFKAASERCNNGRPRTISFSTKQFFENREDITGWVDELSAVLTTLRLASDVRGQRADNRLNEKGGFVSDETLNSFFESACALMAQYRSEVDLKEAVADDCTTLDLQVADDASNGAHQSDDLGTKNIVAESENSVDDFTACAAQQNSAELFELEQTTNHYRIDHKPKVIFPVNTLAMSEETLFANKTAENHDTGNAESSAMKQEKTLNTNAENNPPTVASDQASFVEHEVVENKEYDELNCQDRTSQVGQASNQTSENLLSTIAAFPVIYDAQIPACKTQDLTAENSSNHTNNNVMESITPGPKKSETQLSLLAHLTGFEDQCAPASAQASSLQKINENTVAEIGVITDQHHTSLPQREDDASATKQAADFWSATDEDFNQEFDEAFENFAPTQSC